MLNVINPEFMLLKQIKLEFNHVTASKHQRSQKVKQALTHKRLYNALEMCFTFLFSILWVVSKQKACLQWGYAHSQSEMNEQTNSDSLSLHCRHLLDFKRQTRLFVLFREQIEAWRVSSQSVGARSSLGVFKVQTLAMRCGICVSALGASG